MDLGSAPRPALIVTVQAKTRLVHTSDFVMTCVRECYTRLKFQQRLHGPRTNFDTVDLFQRKLSGNLKV